MIKLKDLLNKDIIKEFRGAWDKGGPAWSGKTYEFISDYMIALSPSVIKRTIGDINVSSFHVTTLDGLKTLKGKLVGSKKSISTFRGVGEDNSILQGMGGIQNDGGIIVHVEGTLLSNGIEDISSRPDESGRRWITNFSFNDMYYPVWIGKSDIHKWFLKTPVIKEILKEWKEDVKNKKYPSALKSIGNIPSEKDLFDVIKWRLSQGLKGTSKKRKAKIIKDYMDMIEKNVWKKNATKIKKSFGQNLNELGNVNNDWNELIISNVKLKDALIVGYWDSEGDTGNDWSEEDFIEAEQEAKKLVSGKVIRDGKGGEDAWSFIKKRGGDIVLKDEDWDEDW